MGKGMDGGKILQRKMPQQQAGKARNILNFANSQFSKFRYEKDHDPALHQLYIGSIYPLYGTC